jgi:hypothetical protein
MNRDTVADRRLGFLRQSIRGGQEMQFPGFWVYGHGDQIEVSRYVFDETELTEASNWKMALQNEAPELAHGFVRTIDMLVDVCRRMGGADAQGPLASHSESFSVSDVESLRLLVLDVIDELDLTVA